MSFCKWNRWQKIAEIEVTENFLAGRVFFFLELRKQRRIFTVCYVNIYGVINYLDILKKVFGKISICNIFCKNEVLIFLASIFYTNLLFYMNWFERLDELGWEKTDIVINFVLFKLWNFCMFEKICASKICSRGSRNWWPNMGLRLRGRNQSSFIQMSQDRKKRT